MDAIRGTCIETLQMRNKKNSLHVSLVHVALMNMIFNLNKVVCFITECISVVKTKQSLEGIIFANIKIFSLLSLDEVSCKKFKEDIKGMYG